MTHPITPYDTIVKVKLAYMRAPQGLTDSQLGAILNVSTITAWRYRKLIPHRMISRGYYTYVPDAQDLEFARLLIEQNQLLRLPIKEYARTGSLA